MTFVTFENCGFETGDLTGWDSYSYNDETSSATVSATSYYGDHVLEMHAHVIRPDPGNIQVYVRKTFQINSGDVLKYAYKIAKSTVSDSAQEDRKTRMKIYLYRGAPYYDSETVMDEVSPATTDWTEIEYSPTLTGTVTMDVIVWAIDAGFS